MATRREALTAAAHKVLLSNPGLYRDITNVQALRREQVSRAAQRLLTLNDPGAGAVERAFQDAGEMSKELPKLLDTKADLMGKLQDTVQEALKRKTALDDGAVKIIVAGIGAEGQTKDAYIGGLSEQNAANIRARAGNEEQQGGLARKVVEAYGANQTPDEAAATAKTLNSFRAAAAGGGTSPDTGTQETLGTLSPQQALHLIGAAAKTDDPAVISSVLTGLDTAGKLDAAVQYMGQIAAKDKEFSGRLDVFSKDTLLAGPPGMSQADRQAQGLKAGLFAMNPARAQNLRTAWDILGKAEDVKQLDDTIKGAVPPDLKKTIDQIDDAIDKASRARDLASPTEVREAIRTSEGVVETAKEELAKAGVEDDGRLMGLGAAVRRATRQQQRGLVKEIGEDKEVKTRRLSMIKEQALARKNKANWAEKPLTEDEANDRKADAVKAAQDASPDRKPGKPLDLDLSLGEEDDSLPEAPDPEEKAAPGTATPGDASQTRKAARAAQDTAIASATASRRREGVLDSLRKYLPKQASAPVEEEEERIAFATPGPKKRPPGSRFTFV
jgi:hypothetical protein